LRTLANVAGDVLRDAVHARTLRRLVAVVTALLVVLALALRADANGYVAAARVASYGALAFAIFACAGFGPRLLSPGRIELLLSLPVRRWELFLGTFVGGMVLALFALLYACLGIVVVWGLRTSDWTLSPLRDVLALLVAFASVYAVMLCTSLLKPRAATSAATGALVLAVEILVGNTPGALSSVLVLAAAALAFGVYLLERRDF
jgi:ABC-type transport system involved in multi-copper enzyme maturation permease subunit